MVLDIVLAPMALQPKTFNVGDRVGVTVAFKYVSGAESKLKLNAGPYYTNILGKQMVDSCVYQVEVTLPAASTPTDKTVSTYFVLLPKANGGIENGSYGLRVWIEGTEMVAEADNVIVVAGNPGSMTDTFSAMMPMLMMLMMMGMVMPMMQGAGVEQE